jgi:hypothetical protein
MSEEDIYCTKCNNKTEQALMLSCDHNLCLSCAAKALNNQKLKNFNSSQYIKCDNCNSLTEIEPETIKQILSEGYENYENENYVIDNMESNDFIDLEDNNMNKMNYPPLTGNQKNNKVNKKISGDNNSASEINIINDLISNNSKCKEHGELLNYLCLDCMSNCVCTECVVHGIHRNHEVLNIKKAYPLIYNKIQDLSKYVNDQIKEVSLINETISKKKNFINALIDRCKNEIHNTFEQIRIRLDNKEKEIINNTTNILNNNIYELNNYNNLIQKKLSSLGNLINQINNIISRNDELNTINYFCENKNNILAQAELNELNNLKDLDTFTNIKIEPDKMTLSKLIDGMNTFHFNINNISDINNAVQTNNNFNKNNNNFGVNQNMNRFNNQFNNNMNMNKNRNQLIRNNQIIQNNNMNKRPKSSKIINQNRQMNNMKQFNNNLNNLNTFQNNRMNNMNRNNNYNNIQDNYNCC